MSKKDELNIKANNIQNYLNALLAGLLGVTGWLFVSYESLDAMLRVTGIIALVAIAVGIAIAQYHINKTAKEIGRLK